MSVFDHLSEPLLLLVIGVASLLFGWVLHTTRERESDLQEEKISQATVEISHAIAPATRAD